MQCSENGFAFIMKKEGLKLMPYLDIGGKPTIGYGHLILDGDRPNVKNGPITKEEAGFLLRSDMHSKEATLSRVYAGKVNQNQFDALCSLAFNVGAVIIARSESDIYKGIYDGDFPKVARTIERYCHYHDEKGVQHESEALKDRRKEESALFLKPV